MKGNITKNQYGEVLNGENPWILRSISLPVCSLTHKSSFIVKNQVETSKNHFLALNASNQTFFAILGPYTRIGAYMGRMGPGYTRMRVGHTCMGRNTHFFIYDTCMIKLIHVSVEISELAFCVFIKVVALNVSFHFPQVPHHSELQCSRYEQTTTHLSWCETC